MNIEDFQNKFGIIGRSKEIRDLVDITMQVARSEISVLVYGESGVGKEVFVNALHGYSSRADKTLVSVNCGAIPEGILESELFGHRKGAFTGAVESRKGYFEIADGGTLFLDEIAEMPLTTQVKLLRVLETQEFMRIGAETVTKVNVRIITATNKDLQTEVAAKRFREDLYFRLKAVTLNIPPLRSRKGDIEALVNAFLNNYSETNKISLPIITNDAIELLKNYNWPGNVRELKNVVETAAALSRSSVLTSASFESIMTINLHEDEKRHLPIYLKRTPEEADRELLFRALFEIKKDLVELKDIVYHSQREVYTSGYPSVDQVIPLDELEKEAIKNAIFAAKGNKRAAAKLLKISERTLYRKIKEYGI
ncbi:MAG: sigma-54 dependent transcriptional regulator [Ignavibacteriaceae bacterium]|nr:sigma-54 dependent transcriptional regulator [Ignavibacteriaceae bacterium]